MQESGKRESVLSDALKGLIVEFVRDYVNTQNESPRLQEVYTHFTLLLPQQGCYEFLHALGKEGKILFRYRVDRGQPEIFVDPR